MKHGKCLGRKRQAGKAGITFYRRQFNLGGSPRPPTVHSLYTRASPPLRRSFAFISVSSAHLPPATPAVLRHRPPQHRGDLRRTEARPAVHQVAIDAARLHMHGQACAHMGTWMCRVYAGAYTQVCMVMHGMHGHARVHGRAWKAHGVPHGGPMPQTVRAPCVHRACTVHACTVHAYTVGAGAHAACTPMHTHACVVAPLASARAARNSAA